MKGSVLGLLFSAVILCWGVSLLAAQVSTEGAPVTIRGKITSFKGDDLLVAATNGAVAAKVLDTTEIRGEIAAKLSDIAPGMYVAASAQKQPDGTFRASRVNIFPENQRGLSEGHRPQSSVPNSTMTNANVERVEEVAVQGVKGPMLTLKYKGGEVKVFVPPDAAIAKRVSGGRELLKPGNTVTVRATQGSDGSVAASQITVTVEPM